MHLELFKALEQNKVRYLVVGGVAVVLHGFLRATADLDLMISMREDNVAAFLRTVKALDYRPRIPVPLEAFASETERQRWKSEKGMLVFTVYHPTRHQDVIDVFTHEPIPFEEAYARRRTFEAQGTPISVVGLEDLIRLKTLAGRRQDQEDIKALRDLDGRA